MREYDLFAPEVMADPNGFLHKVRAESPIAWLPQLDAYMLTRYADVNAALRNKRMDSANMLRVLDRLTPAEQAELAPVRRSVEMWMGHTVPADHVRFQQLLKRYFTPAMVDRLRENPGLMPGAVEEMLRCDGPAGVIGRVATEPVELAGHTVPAGKHVYLALNAANRDPEVFEDPDTFDITRRGSRHLSFGMGTYYCLGAALARMETDECLRILLDRCPGLKPAYETPGWQPIPPIGHRLSSLPVTF